MWPGSSGSKLVLVSPVAWSFVSCPSLYVRSLSPNSPLLPSFLLAGPSTFPCLRNPSLHSIPNQNLTYSERPPLASLTWPLISRKSRDRFFLCLHLAFIVHSLTISIISCSVSFMFNLPSDMVNYLKSSLNLSWNPSAPKQSLAPTELSSLANLHVDWHILRPHVYSLTSKSI